MARTRIQLTKDELRILGGCLESGKYDLNDQVRYFAKSKGIDSFDKFEQLQRKITAMAKDKRRQGRTSLNDWDDLLRRFIQK